MLSRCEPANDRVYSRSDTPWLRGQGLATMPRNLHDENVPSQQLFARMAQQLHEAEARAAELQVVAERERKSSMDSQQREADLQKELAGLRSKHWHTESAQRRKSCQDGSGSRQANVPNPKSVIEAVVQEFDGWVPIDRLPFQVASNRGTTQHHLRRHSYFYFISLSISYSKSETKI